MALNSNSQKQKRWRRHRSKAAVSEVIGLIFFVIIASTLFALLGTLITDSATLHGQSAQQGQLQSYRLMEKLLAYNTTKGIEIFNNGSIASQVKYVVEVNEQTGQIQSLTSWQGSIIPIEGNVTLPPSLTLQEGESLSLITSLGNVFSVSTKAPPEAPTPSFNITIG